jgi:GTP-binding protein Era
VAEAGDGGAETRCGFVALLGAPNAGKSTLLNALVGAKIAIVSPKVQTTRSRVLGIATRGASQIVFVDLPGIFRPRPKKRLERAMVAAAWQGADDADAAVVLFDASRKDVDEDTELILERLGQAGRPAMLALTKIDLVRPPALLAHAERLNARFAFEETFMISAETGSGLDRVADVLAARMPEGPWHFPEDELSDMPMRLLAAELTREQAFLQLHDELPYATAVETEAWEELEDGSVRISQAITVQRESQKAIVVGRGGARIKQLGQRARLEMEALMDRRVHLKLFVKVREDWQDDPDHYRPWGLDHGA